MADKPSLDPENRVLYGDSLQPPPGFVFDAAIATTFSMEFDSVLAVPVSLALFAVENRDAVMDQPLALLEGAERIAGRLAIYGERGRIQARKQEQSRLCSLFEGMIVEVSAPQGGVFHPKIWVLRYRPADEQGKPHMRLLVMSRNLTQDRCWDLSLRLDGVKLGPTVAINKPLVDLVRRLPDLAGGRASRETQELTLGIADDLNRTKWDLPERFDDVSFAVNGLGGGAWMPGSCTRLGIVSPFCDDAALGKLADLSSSKPVLIGRTEELATCSAATRARFERVLVLDETAATEDGEEVEIGSPQGLHAKAFIAESGWDTILTVGSGNATSPALMTGKNVEVFATLSGRRAQVGSIEEILGAQGVGRFLRPFEDGEAPVVSNELREAERRVEEARRLLCRAGLLLRCERVRSNDGGEVGWQISLACDVPLSLEGLGAVSIWPITRGQNHSRDALDSLRAREDIYLGSMPLIDLTRFIAFELTDDSEQASVLFTIGIPIDGLPDDRNAAIFRSIISNRDAFFRYLRLLLSELGDPFVAVLAKQKVAGGGEWGGGMSDDMPLLEDMMRALCAGDDRLYAVERLLRRLDVTEGGVDPVPPEFRALWEAFRTVLAERVGANGE